MDEFRLIRIKTRWLLNVFYFDGPKVLTTRVFILPLIDVQMSKIKLEIIVHPKMHSTKP